MGVDWEALEEAIRVSALRQAEEIITHHPDHVFYAIALDGVSAEPSERIELPVLALNSEQALQRDLAVAQARDEAEASVVNDVDEDDEPYADEEPVAEDEEDLEEGGEEDIDTEFEDIGDLDADDEGFYSTKWNPPDWHWCSLELFDESASELWAQALTAVSEKSGWEPTIRRYYQMLISVMESLRKELAVGRNAEMVAYLSDEDHADQILRRCLTQDQLKKHFPELAAGS
ncbi:DUF4303 domain-containing protein [Paeniglutamicibacter cryotolerans]|uniref:DUF4303 domain-containing protein n=1 Tax=Paeniglutamicibacter cryotolerans TaxID=670079 RepID=A0A839QPC6_9MICC|nr:DUF4303 domain-containing protein [Paeniglutamicibacter cryotolerans]MBB2995836.1 hypothetical protein [Paeniglutamicibacter cryotolerans]